MPNVAHRVRTLLRLPRSVRGHTAQCRAARNSLHKLSAIPPGHSHRARAPTSTSIRHDSRSCEARLGSDECREPTPEHTKHTDTIIRSFQLKRKSRQPVCIVRSGATSIRLTGSIRLTPLRRDHVEQMARSCQSLCVTCSGAKRQHCTHRFALWRIDRCGGAALRDISRR